MKHLIAELDKICSYLESFEEPWAYPLVWRLEKVAQELQEVNKKTKISSISSNVLDQYLKKMTFLSKKNNMLKEIINRQLSCQFHCPNGLHLNEITANMSRLMHRAGFSTIRFGFESSNITTQKDTGGKVNNEQLKIAVTYLKEAGFKSDDIGIYILCGLPGQEASEVFESIHYVFSCGARPIIAEYSPIPGTALWEQSVNACPLDLRGEPLFHNNSLLPCSNEKLTFEMYQELKMMTRMH